MDQGDRALDGVVHAAHDGIEERVLAADDDRHAPGSNARPDGVRTCIDRCDQVVRDHGHVTPVDDELLRHVDETLAVHVVDASVLHAHPHPLERFADPWRRVPRAGPPERRAAVERGSPQVERAWHARMVSSPPVEQGYRLVAMNAGISDAASGASGGNPVRADTRAGRGTRLHPGSRCPRPAGSCRGSARGRSSRGPCSRCRCPCRRGRRRSGRSSGCRQAGASAATWLTSRAGSRVAAADVDRHPSLSDRHASRRASNRPRSDLSRVPRGPTGTHTR
jgi:hypothetical protein